MFLASLSNCKGVSTKITGFNFENIDTETLQNSGFEKENPIIFESAEHYIGNFLKNLNRDEKFHIKNLLIRDNRKVNSNGTMSNEAFRVILFNLLKPKLKLLSLSDLNMVRKNGAIAEDRKDNSAANPQSRTKSEHLMHLLPKKFASKSKKSISTLELRFSKCEINGDFSFFKHLSSSEGSNESKIDNKYALIHHLSITECNISDEDVDNLIEALHGPAFSILRTINLSNNLLTLTAVEKFSALEGRENRIQVYLSSNKVDGKAIDRERAREITQDFKNVIVTV